MVIAVLLVFLHVQDSRGQVRIVGKIDLKRFCNNTTAEHSIFLSQYDQHIEIGLFRTLPEVANRLERISIVRTEHYGLRRHVAAFTGATCRAYAKRSHAYALQKIPCTRR